MLHKLRTNPAKVAAALACGSLLIGANALTSSAAALEFALAPGSEVVGEIQVIEAAHEDTFVRLARQYDVGYEELRQANPDVDPWLPGEGTQIVIPTQYVLPRGERRGIVINVPELRLYYFPEGGDRVITYPISIGKMEWATPYGTTSVVRKAVNPTWYPPESVRQEHAERNDPLPAVVPPGPDNPLGHRALYLGIAGYLLHGTNKPFGLGMRVTHGCIRLFPEDVEALYEHVGVGTQVRLVNQPYKLGWGDDGLYLEAHRPLNEDIETGEWTATELTRIFVAATEEHQTNNMHWRNAETVMRASHGIPRFVSVERMQLSDTPFADTSIDPLLR
ncbi:MAG TPA: L,D-transpeptidase family protein [Gammaproteobacteria bacterium]|nr:L,D-transpeptidase family protein [Gammaproteobacteria bacterium]